MSEYSDAYSATVNFLSQFDPVYRLKTILGEAKEAEQYIEKAEAIVEAFQAEVEKLKAEKRTVTDEIVKLKADQDDARIASIKRLDDEMEEKRKTAAKNMKQSEDAAASRLTAINLDIDAAKEAKKDAIEEATVTQAALSEVNKALAASERERNQAIAALRQI